jgi:hypothetical protein
MKLVSELEAGIDGKCQISSGCADIEHFKSNLADS